MEWVKMYNLEFTTLNDEKLVLYLLRFEDFKKDYDSEHQIYRDLLDLIKVYDFKFFTIDSNYFKLDQTIKDVIKNFLKKSKTRYFFVDIPNYVKKYYLKDISTHIEHLEEIEYEHRLNSKHKLSLQPEYEEKLNSWIEYLKAEIKEKEDYFNLNIRTQWIANNILKLIESKIQNNSYIIHFTPNSNYSKLRTILTDLKVNVVPYHLTKKILVQTTKQF